MLATNARNAGLASGAFIGGVTVAVTPGASGVGATPDGKGVVEEREEFGESITSFTGASGAGGFGTVGVAGLGVVEVEAAGGVAGTGVGFGIFGAGAGAAFGGGVLGKKCFHAKKPPTALKSATTTIAIVTPILNARLCSGFGRAAAGGTSFPFTLI